MIYRILFLFYLIFICHSLYCTTPFNKEHHFQLGIKLPFEFSSYSNDNWNLTVNGIPVPIPDKEKLTKHKTYKSPKVYAGYLFMPKKWIAFGASVSWYKKHGARNYNLIPSFNHQYKEQNFALNADLKLYWMNKKYVDLYSSFSAGALYRIKERKWEEEKNIKHEVITALNYSLIGLTIGNRVYGLFEWQGIISGLKIGMGYKF